MATYNNIKKIKIGDNVFNLYNSDKQLEITDVVEDGISYYPIIGSGNTAAIRQYDKEGFKYVSQADTTTNNGYSTLILGNNKASGTTGNRQGQLQLFDSETHCGTLSTTSNHLTANRNWYLPDKTGTIALTSDITAAISYPVTSVNNKTGAVSLTASDVGALPRYITYVSTITTTAGAHSTISNKSGAVSFNVPTTAAHVGAVPTTRKVNNKALSSDISLTASDVGAVSDVQLNGTSIKSGTVADLVTSELVDIFYPVGSYYETSDTTFDPNTSWGGTWQLETEGQVHISAGTTYTVDGALNNASDGGSPYIQAHTHAHTNPSVSVSGGAHVHNVYARNAGTTGTRATNNLTYGASGHNYITDNAFPTGYGTHTHTVSVSGGGVGAVSGATTGQGGNMPPYIIVNRWHRTA